MEKSFSDVLKQIIELAFSPKSALVLLISAIIYIKLTNKIEVLNHIKDYNYIPIIIILVTGIYLLLEIFVHLWGFFRNSFGNSAILSGKAGIIYERLDTIFKNPTIFPQEHTILCLLIKNNIQEFSEDSFERLFVSEFKHGNISRMVIDKAIQGLLDKEIVEYTSINFYSNLYKITDIAWDRIKNIEIRT